MERKKFAIINIKLQRNVSRPYITTCYKIETKLPTHLQNTLLFFLASASKQIKTNDDDEHYALNTF